MVSGPKRIGWHWFLPDANCPTPTGLIRLDRPVVVLVSASRSTRDGPPAELVVQFSTGPMLASKLTGDWEPIREPQRMREEAMRRMSAKAKRSEEGE